MRRSTVLTYSPVPWRWDAGEHSRNVLRAADGDTIALYDMPYSRPRGEMDVANRALIQRAPEMAEMLRELEWAGGPSSECPECGAAPERTREVDCKPHPQMKGMVLVGTGRMETTGGQHAPDCRLAALLKELP